MSHRGSGAPRPQPTIAREALWHLANLAVLWTFAVAQPLFDLLGDNPEFFAARGSSGFDIICFSVLLVLLPPLAAAGDRAAAAPAGRPSSRARTWSSSAALVALIAVQALKKAIDASDGVLIALAVAIGVALAALCARAEPCARS